MIYRRTVGRTTASSRPSHAINWPISGVGIGHVEEAGLLFCCKPTLTCSAAHLSSLHRGTMEEWIHSNR